MTLKRLFALLLPLVLATALTPARADDYTDTVNVFKKASESKAFFANCYGYAVFPTIGKGGVGIGGAHGTGRVYEKGNYIGDASMTQITVGAQLGGQAFSQIIFFEDKRALDEFTTGEFEFGAQATAVAITAAAGAQAGTGGTGASKNVGTENAKVVGSYQKGMAVFTVAKGGLMYEATIGGQKFSYKKK
ncbi:MAG TPA: YSC84-related protein [Burkholderiaceae bacterium]|nr:YSC84-related protein [Burkholderiaceae bacterium]